MKEFVGGVAREEKSLAEIRIEFIKERVDDNGSTEKLSSPGSLVLAV